MMKKSTKKLLKSLFVAPPHRFKYKTFVMDPNTGDVAYSEWIDGWTDGVNILENGAWIPFVGIKQVTTQSLRLMMMDFLNKDKPGKQLCTYSWEYSSNQVKLDYNHPWYKEMENDV